MTVQKITTHRTLVVLSSYAMLPQCCHRLSMRRRNKHHCVNMDGKNVVVLNALVHVSMGVENGIVSNAVPLPTKPKSCVVMVKEGVVVSIV